MQVRLFSTRLKNKALLPILEDTPSLSLAMRSLYGVADEHCLVTDEVSAPYFSTLAATEGYKLFIGSTENVLSRFAHAAKLYPAAYYIRATADNLLVAPYLAKSAYQRALEMNLDYFCYKNTPYGAGVEIIKKEALERAYQEADTTYDKEHVTPYIYHHPGSFSVLYEDAPTAYLAPKLRATLDTIEDYHLLKAFFKEASHNSHEWLLEFIDWMKREEERGSKGV